MAKRKKELRRAEGRRPRPEEIEHLPDTEKPVAVSNSDNGWPEAWGDERIAVGYVDEVCASTEVPNFEPTEHELLLLVKHWAREALDTARFWFQWEQGISATEARLHDFARRRINRIARAIGDDVVRKAVDEVYEAFAKRWTLGSGTCSVTMKEGKSTPTRMRPRT